MMYSGMTHSARETQSRPPISHHLSYDSEWFPVIEKSETRNSEIRKSKPEITHPDIRNPKPRNRNEIHPNSEFLNSKFEARNAPKIRNPTLESRILPARERKNPPILHVGFQDRNVSKNDLNQEKGRTSAKQRQ